MCSLEVYDVGLGIDAELEIVVGRGCEGTSFNLKPSTLDRKWEFPKTRGTLFRGPYNKDPTV